MVTLRLRAAAVADIREIREYSLAMHGAEAAQSYLSDLDQTMDWLREYPEIGQPLAHMRAGLRSFPCREHRIYYHFAASHVSILRVLHGAMDPSHRLM